MEDFFIYDEYCYGVDDEGTSIVLLWRLLSVKSRRLEWS